jgi:hypothetical protein
MRHRVMIELWFVHAWFPWTTTTLAKLSCELPLRTEMSSPCTRVWVLGKEAKSTCVGACTSSLRARIPFFWVIRACTTPTFVTIGESLLLYLTPFSCMTRGPGCWMSHVSAKLRRTLSDDREGARNLAVDRLDSLIFLFSDIKSTQSSPQ